MPRVHPAKAKTPALEARFDTFPLSHRDETNAYPDVNMANPVCFFDIEIGGQPAGRIEMTVRAIPWMTTIPDGSIDRISHDRIVRHPIIIWRRMRPRLCRRRFEAWSDESTDDDVNISFFYVFNSSARTSSRRLRVRETSEDSDGND